MANLTRERLHRKQWEQFKKMVRDYTALFWICVGAGIVFLIVAAILFLAAVLVYEDRTAEGAGGAFLAGVIGIGLIWAALHARKQPWVEEVTTEATKEGVGATSAGRHPHAEDALAGDRDPTAPAPGADENVSVVEVQDPEQPQEPPPAQE